jgi:hypothetical protein
MDVVITLYFDGAATFNAVTIADGSAGLLEV